MKKSMKKLAVRRETLVHLDLRVAIGGTDGTAPTGFGCGFLPGDMTFTCTDGQAFEN
jgi:hypothetical protein